MAFEIAKAGWLHRQSSVLRRWKHNWFVLYQDGMLKFFECPNSHVAEEAILLPAKCSLIKKATQVSNVVPPAGSTVDCLLALVLNDQTLTLCAESADDMACWYLALEQAKAMRRQHGPPPPPYYGAEYAPGSVYPVSGYPGQVYYGTHPPPYVVQPGAPGQTTVIYADYPRYYYRRGYDGTDMAMGMVAGAALGSMMWGPMLWW